MRSSVDQLLIVVPLCVLLNAADVHVSFSMHSDVMKHASSVRFESNDPYDGSSGPEGRFVSLTTPFFLVGNATGADPWEIQERPSEII